MISSFIESHNTGSFKLKERGFSLVELMVVVAIIGILAGISMTSMDFVRKQRVTSATKQLLGDLQLIRMQAMSSGPSGTNDARQYIRGAGIRLSTSQYVTFQFNDCYQNYQYQTDTTCPPPDGLYSEEYAAQTVTMPKNVQIVLGGALANNILMFDHVGLLRDSNWVYITPPFVIVVQWPSLTSSCISVRSNRIREGAWNGTTCTEK